MDIRDTKLKWLPNVLHELLIEEELLSYGETTLTSFHCHLNRQTWSLPNWGDKNDASVKDYLRRCSINLKQVLYRPIWLQQHVYKLQAEMANVRQHFIQNIWRHLSRPMERRCRAIIGSNGGHMRYLVELSCLNLQMCNALWRTWNLIFALTWKYLIH